MREATLSGLSDLDAVRPRKPRQTGGKTAKGGKAGKTPTWGARLRRFRSRATFVIASAGFAAIMVGIVCNAVMFQKGHHPAPLFGTASGSETAKAAPRTEPPAEAAPVPAPAPPTNRVAEAPAAPPAAQPTSPAPAVAPAHHALHAPARPPAAVHHAASVAVAAHRQADGISRLLGQLPASSPLPLHPAGRVRPGQSVAARATAPVKAASKPVKPAALAAKAGEAVPE